MHPERHLFLEATVLNFTHLGLPNGTYSVVTFTHDVPDELVFLNHGQVLVEVVGLAIQVSHCALLGQETLRHEILLLHLETHVRNVGILKLTRRHDLLCVTLGKAKWRGVVGRDRCGLRSLIVCSFEGDLFGDRLA